MVVRFSVPMTLCFLADGCSCRFVFLSTLWD